MAWNWRNLVPFWNRFTKDRDAVIPRRPYGPIAGVYVTEETAMTVAAFYRGVTFISTQIAKLPWEVKDKTNEIQEGPISNLLNIAPNPEMNALNFRLWAVQQAIVHGNSYCEIERDMIGRPIALWPLPSRDVEVWRLPSGELVYKVTGASVDGGDVYLRPRDVFHVPNFHKTSDGRSGQGLVAFARETLGIASAADRMAGGLFGNSGFPSGVITVKGQLSEDAAKRLKESWDSQNQGRKSGGTRVLEEDATYTPIQVDAEALQFIESRKFGVLEIARFLGLPPTKLFDTTATTFSNVENANLEVVLDTLDSWACNLEIEADVKLLSNRFGGRYTELDLYSVFRGDMTTRANYFSKMMQVGAISPNEIRRREGMSGYSGGDRFFIATNNYTPADRLDDVVDAQIKSGEQKSAPNPPKSEEDDKSDKNLKDAAARFLLKSK